MTNNFDFNHTHTRAHTRKHKHKHINAVLWHEVQKICDKESAAFKMHNKVCAFHPSLF